MKIAFTSCMDATRVPQQPIWTHIRAQEPEVLMLLGDQIYMDWGLSLGSVSKIKKLTQQKGGMTAFAEQMHARYAAQWAVKEFRDLIHWFVPLHGHDQLFICWDDHDFAWNNSGGGINGADDKHSVPRDVRVLAKRLFTQFEQQLKERHGEPNYPAFDINVLPSVRDEGVYQLDTTPIGRVQFGLLDERYDRYSRQDPEFNRSPLRPLLLGEVQMAKVQTLLAKRAPLTVIGGGLPLVHKYLGSAQGWSGQANGEADYGDLRLFLDAAQTPVLYLGGDIHKNEWGGIALKEDGSRSQVLHCTSSGAAIGRVLFKRFAPSFGVVDVAVQANGTGSVGISFFAQVKNGSWQTPGAIQLAFSATGWTGQGGIPVPTPDTLPDHAAAFWRDNNLEKTVADTRELAMLSFRGRDHSHPFDEGDFAISELDNFYTDELPPEGQASRPATVAILADRAQFEVGTIRDAAQANTQLTALYTRAFERASAKGGSVAFFIHGFNKGFIESADQGYGLREMYPGVEPIVFSWPAGYSSKGVFDIGHAFIEARANTAAAASGVFTALACFNGVRRDYPGVNTVLVARSLGATVLRHLLDGPHLSDNAHEAALFSGLDAVLLSSAAEQESGHAQWLAALGCPVYITLNRNDKALAALATLSHKVPLGSITPPQNSDSAGPICYFDCTDFDAIGDHHNYLLQAWNADVIEAQRTLLTGAWDGTTPPTAGWQNLGGAVWGKAT